MGLTVREMDILKRLKVGDTGTRIAEDLGISERTVKFHVGNILRKLEAKNRAEAVGLAVERGWIG